MDSHVSYEDIVIYDVAYCVNRDTHTKEQHDNYVLSNVGLKLREHLRLPTFLLSIEEDGVSD